MSDTYTLRFRSGGFTTLPDIDINPRVTDLSWSLGIKGGFLSLAVGLMPEIGVPVVGAIPNPITLPLLADVRLYNGRRLVWEGRVVERVLHPGGVVGFTAEGYGISGMADNWSRNTSATVGTTGPVLAGILINATPNIRPSRTAWGDPGVAHSYNDFYKMTPAEVVDQIIQEGATNGYLVDFMVLEDRTASMVRRIAPETPQYRVPFDSNVQWRENGRGLYGAVTVEYGTGDTGTLTTEAYSDTFTDTYGIMRAALLTSGDITSGSANTLRNTQLAAVTTAPVISVTIVLDGGRGLRRWDGSEQPADLVRPGEWVVIANHAALPIVGIGVNANEGSATIEIGAPNPSLPKNWNVRTRDIAAKAARYIAPVGGGRTRT